MYTLSQVLYPLLNFLYTFTNVESSRFAPFIQTSLTTLFQSFCTGMSNLASILCQIGPKVTNLGVFKISFSTFWLGEPKCTGTDLKKSQICPIWAQYDSIWRKPDIPATIAKIGSFPLCEWMIEYSDSRGWSSAILVKRKSNVLNDGSPIMYSSKNMKSSSWIKL